MNRRILFIFMSLLAAYVPCAAAELAKPRFEALLQDFASRMHQKSFRHIGDERDFDHGHVLSGSDGEPAAILWHTQELALHEPAGGEYGYVDPDGRNWLQWISDGRIENARRYRRVSYPAGASWDWFRVSELPGFEKNRTIVDKMIDPELLSFDPAKTVQYVFTRVDCSGAAPEPERMRVVLPPGEAVCLSLTR